MHSWDVSIKEAISIQKELAQKVIAQGRPEIIEIIAGIDISYDKDSNLCFCTIVMLNYSNMEIISINHVYDDICFPYVPGLLSFREGPIIIKAYESLSVKPDIILFDGQGIAHPRRLGIASHIGIYLGVPSIGCAKSRLYGTYKEPGIKVGSREYLYDRNGQTIGVVLRTKANVRPVFVSPGHLVGVDESAQIVMSCVRGYRLPQPTRLADADVGKYKKEYLVTRLVSR